MTSEDLKIVRAEVERLREALKEIERLSDVDATSHLPTRLRLIYEAARRGQREASDITALPEDR